MTQKPGLLVHLYSSEPMSMSNILPYIDVSPSSPKGEMTCTPIAAIV